MFMVINNNIEVRKAREQFRSNFSKYTRRFRAAMAVYELSQQDIANAVGLSQPMVSDMLKGKKFSFPIFQHFSKISNNLEV